MGVKLANFTLGPNAILNTEIHNTLVCIKAPNSVNASKRKHENQINHYDKQRRVLMANLLCARVNENPIAEPRRAKPKCVCIYILVIFFLFWIAVWPIFRKETVLLAFCL